MPETRTTARGQHDDDEAPYITFDFLHGDGDGASNLRIHVPGGTTVQTTDHAGDYTAKDLDQGGSVWIAMAGPDARDGMIAALLDLVADLEDLEHDPTK